jgi:SWI/SNF-related matrix-associated actin-dependent regulator of chromatin subfamily A member 5
MMHRNRCRQGKAAQMGEEVTPADVHEGVEMVEEEEYDEELTKEERRELREKAQAEKKEADKIRAAQNADIQKDMDDLIQKRLDFIAKQTDLLMHFDGGKAKAAADGDSKSKRGRMTEKAEDELLMKRAETEASGASVFADDQRLTAQPSVLQNGTLRDYQLEGLNWMVRLYHNGISGILADEMGLGKTVQTVSMIAYLTEFKNSPGPHMVLAPKSTMSNWQKEFRKWLPEHRVVYVGGSKEQREEQLRSQVQVDKFDVVLTSFEILCREKNHFKKFHWRYFVIDEAHRIKNEQSQLSLVVREMKTHSRLLLTGTPLQNNLHELWALLNFLLPDEFADSDAFDNFFQSTEKAEEVTSKLQKILRPFLLRRLKADVEKGLPPKAEVNMYIPMSSQQAKLYANILKKDVDAINGKGGERSRLLNIVMQLRKCCNHPYLFEGQEPGPPFLEGEHLVTASAKLKVLDKLLEKAKAEGNRVLIFSQMTRMLDILEDYCMYRNMKYCRIDGGISGETREEMIEDFMREDSDQFLFLLSTRAGGLGLNLQKANWVVLFDSDWNPQVDIQAMDRAHRIGQTKPVQVFRFITDQSIEEKVVERAFKKLFLDAMVVQQGRLSDKHKAASKDELLEMIRFGADTVIRMGDVDSTDFDIEEVLAAGKKKTEELKETLKQMAGTSMLDNFSMDGGQGLYKKDEDKKDDDVGSAFILDIGQRERKTRGYNVDQLHREQMGSKVCMYGLCMFTCAYIACVYAYGFILARMYICIGDGPIVATFRWADSLCVHGCAFACTCCLSKCLLDVRRRQRQQPGRACPASLLRRNLQTINFLTRSGLMSFTARNVAGGIASNWLSRNSSPRPRCVRVRCVCLCALLIG